MYHTLYEYTVFRGRAEKLGLIKFVDPPTTYVHTYDEYHKVYITVYNYICHLKPLTYYMFEAPQIAVRHNQVTWYIYSGQVFLGRYLPPMSMQVMVIFNYRHIYT